MHLCRRDIEVLFMGKGYFNPSPQLKHYYMYVRREVEVYFRPRGYDTRPGARATSSPVLEAL